MTTGMWAVFVLLAFASGFLGGITAGSIQGSSEWETWFRYYLDAMGPNTPERSAALADAAMEEIAKRRKG